MNLVFLKRFLSLNALLQTGSFRIPFLRRCLCADVTKTGLRHVAFKESLALDLNKSITELNTRQRVDSCVCKDDDS